MNQAGGFKVRGWTCEYTSFSLQDLSRITGLSLTHLRVWRSRGHLPDTARATDQFTTRDVAEILVRHRLTHGNIPPSESGDIGREAAQSLLWYAIANHEVCELWGARNDVDRCKLEFQGSTSVANDLTGLASAYSYLWRPDREVAQLKADIAAVLDQSAHETHFVLSIEHLASRLVEKAQRTLLKIHVSEVAAASRVMRIA